MQYLQAHKVSFILFTLLLSPVVFSSCGKSTDDSNLNIIGGELIKKGDPLVDSVVMLMINIENQPTAYEKFRALLNGETLPENSEGRCTGTVVANPNQKSKWHVVTAAHCLDGKVSSVEIYKGSKSFGDFPNPTSKKEAVALAEKQTTVSNKSAKKDTMKDLGFQLVGKTADYITHPGYNDVKITLKNKVVTLSAKHMQLQKLVDQFTWTTKISSGLLSDLEGDNEDFLQSLDSKMDKFAYAGLAAEVNGDIDYLKKFASSDKHRLLQAETILGEVSAQLESTKLEEKESENNPDHDIAVLTIDGELPASLKALPLATTAFDVNDKLSLLGYGLSLQKLDPAEWTYPTRPEMIQTFQDLKVIELGATNINLQAKEAVFEVEKDLAGLCVGDSGGPALTKSGNTYTLAGVNTQANCRNHSKITVVSEYLDWIHEQM